jgi:hypothetical protein
MLELPLNFPILTIKQHIFLFDIQVSSSIEASLTLDSPDQRSRVKASDWMKSLDLKTPTKQSPSNLVPMGDDSAKKKKKYFRYTCLHSKHFIIT